MTPCFAITIPCLPDPVGMPVEARSVADFLGKLKGLIGLFPHNPDGTLLFFDAIDHARMAAARFMEHGNACGDYILNAELSDDKQEVTIRDIAEPLRAGSTQ